MLFTTYCQTELNLKECISIAQKQSLEASIAKEKYNEAFYQYKVYSTIYLPKLSLSGEAPVFNRSFSQVPLADGSEMSVKQITGDYSGKLLLEQLIPYTAGQLYLSSALQRLDLYNDSTTTSYLATPFKIGIRQPIFTFNEYKWKTKIEPIQFQEAKRTFMESMESVALQTIILYFDLLETQQELQIKQLNKFNTDTLLVIIKERYKSGRINEDEVLQVEVNSMNLQMEVEELQNTLEEKQAVLRDYLGISYNPIVFTPELLSIHAINKEKAIEQALQNNPLLISYTRKILEAQAELEKAKKSSGLFVDLEANLSFSKKDKILLEAYKDPFDDQQLTLRLNIPILDWHTTKYKSKKAEAGLNTVNFSKDKEKLDLIRAVNTTSNKFNIQTPQLKIVLKTMELSSKRFDITKELYLLGRTNFLEYSAAQNEKNNAVMDYLNILRKGWITYYEMRVLTLFDFIENKKIEYSCRYD